MSGAGRVDLEVKSTGAKDAGSFEAVLSAPTVDRDGEIVEVGAFDPLPDRLGIDADHGLSVAATVGSGRPFYDGPVLKVDGRFASTARAQEVRRLVREGHVRHLSVAFVGAVRRTDDEGRTRVVKAELLNASFVAVPSNREARVLAAKRWPPARRGHDLTCCCRACAALDGARGVVAQARARLLVAEARELDPVRRARRAVAGARRDLRRL